MKNTDVKKEMNLKGYDLRAMVDDLYKDGCENEIIFLYTLANRLFYPFGFEKEKSEEQFYADAIMEAVRDMVEAEDKRGLMWIYTTSMNYLSAKGK